MNHCLFVYAWEDMSRCGCSDNEGCDPIACTVSSVSQEAVGYPRYPHRAGRNSGSSWEAYAAVAAADQWAMSRGICLSCCFQASETVSLIIFLLVNKQFGLL